MLLVLVVLPAGVVCAGCGDGSAATPKRTFKVWLKESPLSKAQYIARADRVCDESWAFMLGGFMRHYRRVAIAYQNEQDQRAEGRRFQSASRNVFLAGMQAQFDDVQYLGAPRGERAPVKAVLHSLQRAIFNGWERRITSAKQFAEIFNHFNHLAYHYGLNHCLVYESNFRERARQREDA